MRNRSFFSRFELIASIVLIALGVFTFLNPSKALSSLVVLYGLFALLTGIVDIVMYVRMERFTGFGPALSLAAGILSVMSGIMLMVYPSAGKWVLSLLFPIWFIAHCISRLCHLSTLRLIAGRFTCYATLILNILGLILGIFMILRPRFAMISVGWIVALYLILLGCEGLVTALSKMGYR